MPNTTKQESNIREKDERKQATLVGRHFTARDFQEAKKYRSEIRKLVDEALGKNT